MEEVSDAQLFQFYVLYCIYEATNGIANNVLFTDPLVAVVGHIPGWINTGGWASIALDVDVLNPCHGWHGIACDANHRVAASEL